MHAGSQAIHTRHIWHFNFQRVVTHGWPGHTKGLQWPNLITWNLKILCPEKITQNHAKSRWHVSHVTFVRECNFLVLTFIEKEAPRSYIHMWTHPVFTQNHAKSRAWSVPNVEHCLMFAPFWRCTKWHPHSSCMARAPAVAIWDDIRTLKSNNNWTHKHQFRKWLIHCNHPSHSAI